MKPHNPDAETGPADHPSERPAVPRVQATALVRVLRRPIKGLICTLSSIALNKYRAEAEPLLQQLQAADDDTRVHAVRGLAVLASPAPVGTLVDLVADDSLEVVLAALKAIETLDRPCAFDAARAVWRDPRWLHSMLGRTFFAELASAPGSAASAGIHGEVEWLLIRMCSSDPELQASALKRLSAYDEETLVIEADRLAGETKRPDVVLGMLREMVKMNPKEALEEALAGLEVGKYNSKRIIMEVLSEMGEDGLDRAVELAVMAWENPPGQGDSDQFSFDQPSFDFDDLPDIDSSVSGGDFGQSSDDAPLSLGDRPGGPFPFDEGRHGDPRNHDPLLSCEQVQPLFEGGSGPARLEAVEWLAENGDGSHAELLLGLFDDPDEGFRRAALHAAMKLAPDRWDLIPRLLLQNTLRSSSSSDRSAAVKTLGEVGEMAGAGALIKLLGDSDDDVRAEALTASLHLAPHRSRELALWGLSDPSYQVTGIALDALKELGPAVLLDVLARFDSAAPGLQAGLLDVVGCVGGHEQAMLMIDHLENPDGMIRLAAFKAAVRLDPGKAVEIARQKTLDDSQAVRREAVQCLGRVGDERVLDALEPRVDDEVPAVRLEALRAAGRIAPGRAGELALAHLEDEDRNVCRVALQVAEAAGAIDVPIARSLLTSPHEELVCGAIRALAGQTTPKEIVPSLLIAATTAEWIEPLIDVVVGLSPASFEEVLALVRSRASDGSARVRRQVVRLISRHGGPEEIPVLERLVVDSEVSVRELALPVALALAPAGGDDLRRAAALRMLQDSSATWIQREKALRGLAKFGIAEDFDLAVASLEDSDSDVRDAALDTASRFEPERALDLAMRLLTHSDGKFSSTAARIVSDSGAAAVSRLRNALTSADGEVRIGVFRLLCEMGVPFNREILAACRKDPMNRSRRRALEIAAEHAPNQASALARELLEDDWYDVRRDAVKTLGESGCGADVACLTACLSDDDDEVRLAALQACVRLAPDRSLELAARLFDDDYSSVRRVAAEIARSVEVPDVGAAQKMLTCRNGETVADGIEALRSLGIGDDLPELIINAIPRAADDGLRYLVNLIEEIVPDRLPEVLGVLRRVAIEGHPSARSVVPDLLVEHGGIDELPLLEEMLGDSEGTVRDEALAGATALALLREDEFQIVVARKSLQDESWCKRRDALKTLGRLGGFDDIELVVAMFEDWDNDVQEAALAAACNLAPDRRVEFAVSCLGTAYNNVRDAAWKVLKTGGEAAIPAIRREIRKGDSTGRAHLVGLLGKIGGRAELGMVLGKLKDRDSETRGAAFSAALVLAPEREVELAREFLRDECEKNRILAVAVFRNRGQREEIAELEACLVDPSAGVRGAVFETVRLTDRERASGLARRLLVDEDPGVAKQALELVRSDCAAAEVSEIALHALAGAAGGSCDVLVDHIREHAPGRLPEAVQILVGCSNVAAHEAALGILKDLPGDSQDLNYQPLLKSQGAEVREIALKILIERDTLRALDLARDALSDPAYRVRVTAVEELAKHDEPWLVEDLLPMARDEDDDVRCAAITALARHDDPRVFSELVSSLNDVKEIVREKAIALLEGGPDKVRVLSRLSDRRATAPLWEVLRARVVEINRWASGVGQELLGRSVRVTQYRQGIGRTKLERGRGPVEIEVSDAALTSGHPHGEEIMRAIALHEIGHHLCDHGARGFRTMNGIACSEGVGEIFDVLLDERLERVLRSRRPEWGVFFDRLASYAFAQNMHIVPLDAYAKLTGKLPEEVLAAIHSRELPGSLAPARFEGEPSRVALKDSDFLVIPGALPPLGVFLAYLRCGFDPRMNPDPRFAQAIDLVPSNLKDLPHFEVLKVARSIGDLLGRSESHKRDVKRLQALLRSLGKDLQSLSKMLKRLAEMGAMPEWSRGDTPGVRVTPQQEKPPPLRVLPGRPPSPRDRGGRPGKRVLNLGREEGFDSLIKTERLPFDAGCQAALVGPIRPHIRVLRSYFERLGIHTVDEHASRRGRRLDMAEARKLVWRPTLNVMVHSFDVVAPDAYLGILIDRSGSMFGEKISRAKSFAALVCESARGLRGIEGHVNAFDDDTFFELGSLQKNSVATLEAGGGNNDAGALERAAQLALSSRKRRRALIMISDGSPTECTFESLKGLVGRLTQDCGIVCAQVAVDEIEQVAFPHSVDLTAYSFEEAVARFGRLLIQLTAGWR